MHLNPLGVRQFDLGFAVHESSRRSHVEAYLAGADPQQCALAVRRAHINTTIQLSFLHDLFIICYFGWLLRGFHLS